MYLVCVLYISVLMIIYDLIAHFSISWINNRIDKVKIGLYQHWYK